MLTKRIIPCLDIKDGRTVKGVNFVSLRDAGDPVELAVQYAKDGADELVFLDITATHEKRKTLTELVQRIAEVLNIPFTVGGGVSSSDDVSAILNAGADKVAVNSAAVKNPELITELARKFGSQCVVVAIDARFDSGKWVVYLNGGRQATDLELFSWAETCERLGAGEILFTSMDHDGTKSGFANDALAELSSRLNIPVIASGGAGTMHDFVETFKKGKSDAALAASIFHFGEITLPELKKYLAENDISVRI
jgi:imidazole glycerol-phosphate synthase subunit HisF